MATWNRVASGSTAGNISMNVDIGIQSVTRTSNSNVRVVYGVRFAMATNTYTYNSVAAFCPKGGSRYYAFKNGSGHTSNGTWYYANTSGSTTTGETCPFTIDIPVGITQTSASFEVGYGWDAHTPNQVGSSSISVSFPTGATAPTGLYCKISSYTETKVTLSGGYTSDGGASVSGTGYQYKTSSGNWTSFSNGSTALTPGTKYYFRYYATNSQGTSYSDGNANVTLPNYPSINSTPNFTIGNTLTIGLYNPLGRSCKVYLINASNTSEQNGNTTTGTSISGYTNATYKKLLYDGIPSAKSGTYKVRLVVSSLNNRDTTITGGTYSIKNDGSEIPSFSANNWSYVANLTQLTKNNQTVINGYSQLTFTVNTPATSAYSSPIASYTYKWGSQSKNSTKGNTVSGGTGNVLEVSAIDSRQLSKATSKTLTSGSNYVPYTSPILDYSSSYTNRKDGIGSETHLTLRGNLSVMKFGTDGVANAIHSAQYQVYDYSTSTWGNPITIPVSNFTLSSSGYFTLNNYQIHANGTSGGFTVGKRYGLKIILKDAQGLLGTLNSNTIAITDGKIARDVYQDSNGNYHQGINGMADSNYTEVIHGSLQVTNYSDHFRTKSIVAYNGRQSSADFDHQYPQDRVSEKLDIASNSMSTHKPPSGDGFIKTFFWDNNGKYDLQVGMAHDVSKLNQISFRGRGNANAWPNWKLLLDMIYPLGSIYISATPTNPGNIFGGTWQQLKNHFLFATNATSGNKGKDAVSSHTGTAVSGTAISIDQMPSHNHGGATGGAGGHNHEVFVNGDTNFPLITYPGWNGGQNGRGASVQNTYNGFRTYTNSVGNHTHSVTAQGGGKTHNHNVSYIEVYVWQRTK